MTVSLDLRVFVPWDQESQAKLDSSISKAIKEIYWSVTFRLNLVQEG